MRTANFYYAGVRTKTTLEIEAPIYKKLKTMANQEGKTLKKLMDELIVLGLKEKSDHRLSQFDWPGAVDLAPLIAINDKESVQNILDREEYVLD